MNHTFDWTGQFEVIQVASENMFTQFLCVPHDLNEKITPRQFTFLEFNQKPGRGAEWLRLTVSPRRQCVFNVCYITLDCTSVKTENDPPEHAHISH